VQVDHEAETVRMIGETGGEAIFVTADVPDLTNVRTLMSKTIDVFQRFDCTVENIGIGGADSTTADYSEEAWNSIIEVNLTDFSKINFM
jgi:NAD(P)-dependent dehydrogenase (short-subunit alcohol dehydrogenase family)